MKTWVLSFLFMWLGVSAIYAQKIDLEKWVSHTVDSLQKNHMDTIEYYHAYCGECLITIPPGYVNPPENHSDQCEIGNGWVQTENRIIYKQKNKYSH